MNNGNNSKILNALGIDPGIIIIILLILIIILFVIVFSMLMHFKRFDKKYKMFMRGKDGVSLEKTFLRSFHELDKLIESNNNHREEIKNIKETLSKTLTKRAIVKYDAFKEVGGKLSFALAMLDGSNSGYVMNVIHSREGCYTYIKEILNGESFIALGEEEKEALRMALEEEII
ncbi:MAG TPA: DUF4446 family protein [Candidatus Merdenecus merdavium]|nr:DUF4446 family protein [Candidatus Merdenecus merdavium]